MSLHRLLALAIAMGILVISFALLTKQHTPWHWFTGIYRTTATVVEDENRKRINKDRKKIEDLQRRVERLEGLEGKRK